MYSISMDSTKIKMIEAKSACKNVCQLCDFKKLTKCWGDNEFAGDNSTVS